MRPQYVNKADKAKLQMLQLICGLERWRTEKASRDMVPEAEESPARMRSGFGSLETRDEKM